MVGGKIIKFHFARHKDATTVRESRSPGRRRLTARLPVLLLALAAALAALLPGGVGQAQTAASLIEVQAAGSRSPSRARGRWVSRPPSAVNYSFRRSPDTQGDYYEMNGTVRLDGEGAVSIRVRGRYGSTWGEQTATAQAPVSRARPSPTRPTTPGW